MRIIFALVLVFGLGLAGFAAWKTSDYINSVKASEQAAVAKIVPTVPIFIAKKDLPFGHVLTKDDVRMVHWPKSALPETAFTDPAVLFHEDETKKRTVVRQMDKSEPLLSTKLTEPGADAGINTRLGRGMRAFQISIDPRNSVAGQARIGDRIDIYWSGSVGGLSNDLQGEITRLIESGVLIIGAQGGEKGGGRNITVEATPQQVARLTQAQMTGRMSLALLGVADDTTAEVADIDRRGLLGIEKSDAAPAPVEAERVCTIRTRRGGEAVDIEIPCTN